MLMDKILKNSPTKYASKLSESAAFNKKDIITTDIPIINVAFSGEVDGGIYSGLTLLAGPSKTFKTNVALVCVRAYLDRFKDAVCVLYDSEGGITPDYLTSQGVDPNRVVHIPIEHLEMLKFDMVKQLKELDRGDKVIFVIDSIGNTASLKELQDALDEKTVAEMQRAKVIKGLFRMVTPSLVNKNIPCIAVCHTYDEMGCLHGDTVIKTINGEKKIKNIKIDDVVYTNNGIQKVTHVYLPSDINTHDNLFLEIKFDDGSVVKCTDNHKFLNSDKKWIMAKDFKVGTVLY